MNSFQRKSLATFFILICLFSEPISIDARSTNVALERRGGMPMQPSSFLQVAESNLSNLDQSPGSVDAVAEDLRFRSMGNVDMGIQDPARAPYDKLSYRPRRRRTYDNRICAAAFVQDGRTYTDATNERAPDGSETGREWCYVDPNEGGTPNWQYVISAINYEAVRQNVREVMQKQIGETQAVTEKVKAAIQPCEQRGEVLDQVAKAHGQLDGRLNKLEEMQKQLEHNFEVLRKSDETAKGLQDKQEAIKREIERLKVEEASGGAAGSGAGGGAGTGADASVVKSGDGYSLGPPTPGPRFSCKGMLGYEEENEGDGLRGKYWANIFMRGRPEQRVDKEVAFDWNDSPPHPGITPEQFSVRWEGFFKAPFTGQFQFTMREDNGARIYINSQLIVNDRMPTPAPKDLTDSQKADYYLHAFKDMVKNPKTDVCVGANCNKFNDDNGKIDKAESKKIDLKGGQKYPITVEVWHSVHNQFDDKMGAYAHFGIKSEKMLEKTIPSPLLYTANVPPPLKITGFDPRMFQLAFLREGDYLYKDDTTHRMADIPLQFLGLHQLRSKSELTQDIIFQINGPAVIYVAVNGFEANPLAPDFEDGGEIFSVLKVPMESPAQDKPGNPLEMAVNGGVDKLAPPKIPVLASESIPFKVYFKKFIGGQVKIPIRNVGTSKSAHLTVFAGGDVNIDRTKLACGGEQIVVSALNGDYFDSCRASSEYNDQWKCDFAFNQQNQDKPFSSWATNNEGVGSWIEVKLKKKMQIEVMRYKNRNNPLERNQELELVFGDGSTQTIQVANDDSLIAYPLTMPIITRTIRVNIKGVYGTINNGGSFEFLGTPCQEQAPERDGTEFLKPLPVACDETLFTSRELKNKEIQVGEKSPIKCGQCFDNPINVYGNRIYSEDSGVCKAAIHDGLIPATGGLVTIVVKDGQFEYAPYTKNGITTKPKKMPTERSFSFEEYKPPRNDQDFKPGQKIDVLDKFGNTNKWKPAEVVSVSTTPEGKQQLLVGYEGMDDKYNEQITVPSDRVKPCGKEIADRNCPPVDQGAGVDEDKKQIRINFQPKNAGVVKGYIVDDGSEFGSRENGKYQFGWSKDMRSFARQRSINPDKLLDTVIMFPPNIKSVWCQAKDPHITCTSADWSIKLKNGKYKVRVTIGDPQFKAAYFLQLNTKTLIKDKVLEENQFQTFSEDVHITDGYLRLTADCNANCDHAWSRVNVIEILPDPDKPTRAEEALLNEPVVELGCGGAFKNGRCNDGTNPENCVYQDVGQVQKCTGPYQLVDIPMDYICQEQRGLVKCIKKQYDKEEECKLHCPLRCVFSGVYKCTK